MKIIMLYLFTSSPAAAEVNGEEEIVNHDADIDNVIIA
jgi:hypothetical protein